MSLLVLRQYIWGKNCVPEQQSLLLLYIHVICDHIIFRLTYFLTWIWNLRDKNAKIINKYTC